MTGEPDFGEFLAGLHGGDRRPFVWQQRAASDLSSTGWWKALRAPTGAGKTTLIECWLWALAQSGPDLLGRRLLWVVDRRAVIDQVHAHAERVLTHLLAPSACEAVRTVAQRLIDLGGGQPPRASLWRGGLDDEANIAMRNPVDPASVAIISSTVDQVGSRLLFRGYGLGQGSRALHAGLLGVDSTLVLDEAHLAGAFLQTATTVGVMQASAAASPRPAVRRCAVSATIGHEGTFELSGDELADAPIARRTQARKTVTIVDGNGPSAAVKAAREAAFAGAKVIGIVMNTVSDARRTFDALTAATCVPMDDRVLLIGPVRPVDRLDLLDCIPTRHSRAARERPFFVVATQTIEVGVDLDFDALVTACAPLSALVQRFGRLDRGGEVGETPAWILTPPKADPVYGPDATATWEWLTHAQDNGEPLNLGVSGIAELRTRFPDPPTTPEPFAPILQTAHVRALEVTDATEEEGPEIDVLLRGPREPSADVSIVWRADVPADLPEDSGDVAAVSASLDRRPAHADEALSVSVAAARRWIVRRAAEPLGDVSSLITPKLVDRNTQATFAAWRIDPISTKPVAVHDARALRAGDRVIVASASGGADDFGWAPESREPVADLGSLSTTGHAIVLSDDRDEPDGVRCVGRWAVRLAGGEVTPDEPAPALSGAIARALPAPDKVRRPKKSFRIAQALDALANGIASPVDGDGLLICARSVRSTYGGAGAAVGLDLHQAAVTRRACATADAVGLPAEVCRSIRRAAAHHDEGKRDERFQAWLRGGRPQSDGALAKSAGNASRARRTALRIAAGWPAGKRHELLSAIAIAEAYPDDDLAPWLAATHHGFNRPWPDAVDDPAGDVIVRLSLDAEISDGGEERTAVDVPAGASPNVAGQLHRLSTLSEQFGPWGLAFLEAIVVTADRAISSGEDMAR